MNRILIALALAVSVFAARADTLIIVLPTNCPERVLFGANELAEATMAVKLSTAMGFSENISGLKIILRQTNDPAIGSEGFNISRSRSLESEAGNTGPSCFINYSDDSGALYGSFELAGRIRAAGRLPEELNVHDAPAMTLRGTCVAMQKTFILPGRKVYEYPYTPELFPWFYDQQLWTEYLDFLAANRMNTLYLWSGHPFASLVRLKDYPYAVEVPADVFAKNVEQFRWLATECDKRGIWLVQMFYNIIVSKPFAETNGISTQSSAPTPLTEDYTRKSIAEFVKQYPNVGLMVCLGEALRETTNQLEWCTNVILPGVLDGMRAANLKQEPPVVIRTHAMDPYAIMPAAYQVYSNIFTETKYNGESLTTWQPRGKAAEVHRAMSKLGPHLVNIHILSDLEPFRYGDTEFIKKSVQASRDSLGASGVHLYPLSYWNWPYSPDIAEERGRPAREFQTNSEAAKEHTGDTPVPLLQWRRDWIWFEAWARYSWNPHVEEKEDYDHWISRLANFYGNTNAAVKIYEAYNAAGEVAPRLIRRFGITEGNRQTLSLGMTLDQLVNPNKYGAIEELWLSQAPPGERLDEFVRKEWNHQPHVGETPETIIADVLNYSIHAVDAAEAAAPLVTRNRDEFKRLQNDILCIRAMSKNYTEKATAAKLVLTYNYSHDIGDMERAAEFLEQSLLDYQTLVSLTGKTYHYANSMQTSQRKIPVSGGKDGKPANYLWSQLLPVYEKELADFRAKVAELKLNTNSVAPAVDESKIQPWPAAPFKLISTNAETYKIEAGAAVFTDRGFAIQHNALQLDGLTGIRFSHAQAKDGMPPIEFEVSEPVYVLVGYFDSTDKAWLQVPKLEFAAQADERGGVDTVLENAATIAGCPNVNLHAFRFDAGMQKLELIGKGSFVILGVVPQTVKLK
jgi:hypothetical protein